VTEVRLALATGAIDADDPDTGNPALDGLILCMGDVADSIGDFCEDVCAGDFRGACMAHLNAWRDSINATEWAELLESRESGEETE
jgi:hypothetical protein